MRSISTFHNYKTVYVEQPIKIFIAGLKFREKTKNSKHINEIKTAVNVKYITVLVFFNF